jgi:predicted tellurium resistance membrane protein TerC
MEVHMKWLLNILGVILLLVGVVWILQGINILPGSFMSGQLIYALLGIIVGVIGVAILAYNSRRRKVLTSVDHTEPDR